MSIVDQDILGNEMALESKIKWFEGMYIYMGISKEIREFEENTQELDSKDKLKALNILHELVQYYSRKYVISSMHLEDKFNKLKESIGD